MAQGAYETVLGIDAIATGIAAVSGGGGLCASVAGCTIGGPAAALGGVGIAAGTVLSVHGGSVLGNAGNGLNSTLQNIAAKNNWGNHNTLIDHTNRHAADFGLRSNDYNGYAQKANEFITNKQYTNVFREGQDFVYWNKDTNIAVYTDQYGKIRSAHEVTNVNKINTYIERAAKQ
jgi:hypothetical protein